MPSPIDILLDPVSLAILAMYALLMVWEAIFPARRLPAIPYWHLKGIVFFFFFFYLSTYLPLLYAAWLPQSQLIDLSGINPIVAGIAGVLLYELGMYVWHRVMHNNNMPNIISNKGRSE